MQAKKRDKAEMVAQGPDIISHLPYREYDSAWVDDAAPSGAIRVDNQPMLYWLPDGVEDIRKGIK